MSPVEIKQPLNDYLKQKHASYTETLLGEPEQPLSLAIVAENADALLTSLRKSGWRTTGGGLIFVGVAREFDAIQWGLLHQILPDVDAAADRFVDSLKHVGQLRQSCRLPLVKPMTGHYLLGKSFFTRGSLWLIDLTQNMSTKPLCTGLQLSR